MHNVAFQIDQYDLWADLVVLTDHEVCDRQIAPMLSQFPNAERVTVSYSAGITPAFYIAEWPDETIIGIAGASTASMFGSFFQGSLYPGAVVGKAHVNGALLPPAKMIINTLFAGKSRLPPLVTVVGHSYGGCLAEVLVAWLSQDNPDVPFQLLTGGAPRAGGVDLAAVLAPIPNVRLMNYRDPLPRFPPHFDEAPVASCLLPYTVVYNWSFFAQVGGGFLLGTDGSETPAVLPPLTAPIADADLVSWLLGANGAGSSDHNYRTYLHNLGAGIAGAVAPPLPLSLAGLKDEPVFTPTADVVLLGPVQGPVAFQKEKQEMPNVYIPPDYRMKVVKVGKTYQVTWGPFTIVQGQTHSNAKTYAKYGNKFCRVMQTVAKVSQQDLHNALSWYLTAASSATTGFQPVLQVV